MHNLRYGLALVVLTTMLVTPAEAGLLSKLRNRDSTTASRDLEAETKITFGERDMYVHVPTRLPPEGKRALVVVLHGGLGNAERIVTMRSEKGMNLDDVADKYGFLVAYMNGTKVSKIFGSDKRGWNAGYCCNLAVENNIDDVSYLTGAVQHLVTRYGIDTQRIYGIGHSNGAMMVQRMICETQVFSAGISFSGSLNMDTNNCPGAQGRTILSVLGKGDTAVPLEGGYGKGISRKNFKTSQEYSRQRIEGSGGRYILQVYDDTEHNFDTIMAAVQKEDGIAVDEKVARFFGLTQ